jgi:hypothetical protein
VRTAEPGFEIAYDNALVSGGDLPSVLQPKGERRHAGDRLQGVLRRDQPPHLVEREAPGGEQAQMQMAAMGGVERAAQQPDAAMPAGARPARASGAQGRTCPLPRTRYL